MNAGGVSKACKSNDPPTSSLKEEVVAGSGKRVRNTLVTYLEDGHNLPKGGLIPDTEAGAQAIRFERVRPKRRTHPRRNLWPIS